ncbi:MAG: ATP-binding protein [Methylocystis sp.]|uniref:AAA family ATPase n=1 Tax=Methylocystis sp. TaxID=1911079 RepID=UPI00395DF139
MIITNIEVDGLPRHDKPIKAKLNSDLNIVTGRNGAGKTTLLKLLWYIISGNIEHAVREVPFTRASVTTDQYSITITKSVSNEVRIEFHKNGERTLFTDDDDDDIFETSSAVDRANDAIKDIGSSLFFPTFRRIEGGFSVGQNQPNFGLRIPSRAKNELEDAMLALSRRLTVEKHSFVAAISTVDIVTLLMRQYTEMSEASNDLQKFTSHQIIDQIKNYKEDSSFEFVGKSKADKVIDNIKTMIEAMDGQRAKILAPLDAVKNLVEKLFHHSGIKLGTRLSFGDAATAVSSDKLSAGEKQMLSFICYNAFYNNSVIFIDEPELSLHVDWQRQLFPTLREQKSSNQFVVATHSPFIYSKYPDKEILMSEDRGAEGNEID